MNISTDQFNGLSVLEVGGGEFGLLKALSEYGASCYGIDISTERVNYAKQVHPDSSITFYVGDICNYESVIENLQRFDLIILRDVIEHIPNKALALKVKLLIDNSCNTCKHKCI